MQNLSTDPNLLNALRSAANRPLTAAQIRAQKVDYIVSMLSDDKSVTKAAVEKELDRLNGCLR